MHSDSFSGFIDHWAAVTIHSQAFSFVSKGMVCASTRSDNRLEKPVTLASTVSEGAQLHPSCFQSEWTNQGFEETKFPEIVGSKIQILEKSGRKACSV